MSARSRVLATAPLLVVSDLQRSVDFYMEKLGFVEPGIHGDPPCFAMLNRDGFDLMLSLQEAPGGVRPNGPTGAWDVYMRVLDIAAEIEALTAAGVRIDKGPADRFYEIREIEIVDPDGHRWCLGQDISAYPFASLEVWEGVLDVGQAKFKLVMKLSPADGGTLRGLLDSPDQGAMNQPMDRVTREGGALSFEMKAIGASYEGVLTEDGTGVSGTWSQGSYAWPLAFRRVAA